MRTALILALLALSSCSARHTVEVGGPGCWDAISIGDQISGSVDVYYFPNTATLMQNQECPRQSYGLRLDDPTFDYLKDLYSRKSRGNPDVIAAHGRFTIEGLAAGEKGKAPDLILVSKLQLSPGSALDVEAYHRKKR